MFLEAHRYSTYSDRKLVPCALITQAAGIIDFANHYIPHSVVFETEPSPERMLRRGDTTTCGGSKCTSFSYLTKPNVKAGWNKKHLT